MKLSELLKLDQEGRDKAYMGMHGLYEVDPIGILEKVLDDFDLGENEYGHSIVIAFAKELKKACTRIEAPEGTIRSELDEGGGAE